MLVRIFTAFPQYFNETLNVSLLGKARQNGIWSCEIVNLRDFGIGKHKKIDDTSFGGGNGLIMRPDILANAMESTIKNINQIRLSKIDDVGIFVTSPTGELLTQSLSTKLSKLKEINIICNRFEGIDQRVIDFYKIKPISIGNFVLLGGEVAACVILESTLRLISGFLKNENTTLEESFSEKLGGMGEYPQYTRPVVWNEVSVPEVLKSGNHSEIKKWRMKNLIDTKK